MYTLATCFFFFFNDTATTEIYTLSLHDALPISLGVYHLRGVRRSVSGHDRAHRQDRRHATSPHAHGRIGAARGPARDDERSEEHTSELQSQSNLVCRLLLEKKNIQDHACYDHDT